MLSGDRPCLFHVLPLCPLTSHLVCQAHEALTLATHEGLRFLDHTLALLHLLLDTLHALRSPSVSLILIDSSLVTPSAKPSDGERDFAERSVEELLACSV